MNAPREHGTGPDADEAARAALVAQIAALRQQLRVALRQLSALSRYDNLKDRNAAG